MKLQVPRKYLRALFVISAIAIVSLLLSFVVRLEARLNSPPQGKAGLVISSQQPPELPESYVPIFVQDEHQNAQPRWLEVAAEHDISSFTLIHIDAHSDMAIPERYTRNPKTKQQQPFTRTSIRTSNDEFIEDAIHSELIDRVTWIVPDWGQVNEEDMFTGQWEDSKYVSPNNAAIAVGYFLNSENVETAMPCDCILLGYDWAKDSKHALRHCSSSEDEQLASAKCRLVRAVPVEVMVGSEARVRGLSAASPEAETPNIILDIDEDYFATGDPLAPLVRAGWDNASLAAIDAVTMSLCSPTEADEHTLDTMLKDLVKGQSNEAHVDKFLCKHHFPDFRSSITQASTLIAQFQQVLASTKSALGQQGMSALLDVGFCATPRSERADTLEDFPAQMAVCTGVDQVRDADNALYRTNDMVLHYVPSPMELEKKLDEMRTFLLEADFGARVRVVTLVRSIRDGYLPRRLWKRVEEHILETLKKMIPNSRVVMDGRPQW